MQTSRRALITLIFAVIAISACATGRAPAADADPQRARAALATLFVRNETAGVLTILYRTVGPGSADVGVGRAPAGATTEMAPAPAGEPLILIARDATGAELVLAPQTFQVDGAWTWHIPPDAVFTRRSP